MLFILGIITGLVSAGLIVLTTLICDRKGVNWNDKAKKVVDTLYPPETGKMFKPQDLSETRKNRIIEKNKEEGKETKLTDLL